MDNNTSFPHLTNAPITEALIDIRVSFHNPPTTEELKNVANAIKEEFPLQTERNRTTISFNIQPEKTESSVGKESNGLLIHTQDKKYAVQLMRESFSLSRLQPYLDWSELRTQTEKYWEIYADILKPDRVTRLAVRYINKLLIPTPIQDFSDYFTQPVEIPKGLPQGLASYMTRLVIPEPETQSVAIVQQVLEGSTPEDKVSILFDIDAFKFVDLSTNDHDAIWSILENLHEYKNRIFFNSLTDKTIGLYK